MCTGCDRQLTLAEQRDVERQQIEMSIDAATASSSSSSVSSCTNDLSPASSSSSSSDSAAAAAAATTSVAHAESILHAQPNFKWIKRDFSLETDMDTLTVADRLEMEWESSWQLKPEPVEQQQPVDPDDVPDGISEPSRPFNSSLMRRGMGMSVEVPEVAHLATASSRLSHAADVASGSGCAVPSRQALRRVASEAVARQYVLPINANVNATASDTGYIEMPRVRALTHTRFLTGNNITTYPSVEAARRLAASYQHTPTSDASDILERMHPDLRRNVLRAKGSPRFPELWRDAMATVSTVENTQHRMSASESMLQTSLGISTATSAATATATTTTTSDTRVAVLQQERQEQLTLATAVLGLLRRVRPDLGRALYRVQGSVHWTELWAQALRVFATVAVGNIRPSLSLRLLSLSSYRFSEYSLNAVAAEHHPQQNSMRDDHFHHTTASDGRQIDTLLRTLVETRLRGFARAERFRVGELEFEAGLAYLPSKSESSPTFTRNVDSREKDLVHVGLDGTRFILPPPQEHSAISSQLRGMSDWFSSMQAYDDDVANFRSPSQQVTGRIRRMGMGTHQTETETDRRRLREIARVTAVTLDTLVLRGQRQRAAASSSLAARIETQATYNHGEADLSDAVSHMAQYAVGARRTRSSSSLHLTSEQAAFVDALADQNPSTTFTPSAAAAATARTVNGRSPQQVTGGIMRMVVHQMETTERRLEIARADALTPYMLNLRGQVQGSDLAGATSVETTASYYHGDANSREAIERMERDFGGNNRFGVASPMSQKLHDHLGPLCFRPELHEPEEMSSTTNSTTVWTDDALYRLFRRTLDNWAPHCPVCRRIGLKSGSECNVISCTCGTEWCFICSKQIFHTKQEYLHALRIKPERTAFMLQACDRNSFASAAEPLWNNSSNSVVYEPIVDLTGNTSLSSSNHHSSSLGIPERYRHDPAMPGKPETVCPSTLDQLAITHDVLEFVEARDEYYRERQEKEEEEEEEEEEDNDDDEEEASNGNKFQDGVEFRLLPAFLRVRAVCGFRTLQASLSPADFLRGLHQLPEWACDEKLCRQLGVASVPNANDAGINNHDNGSDVGASGDMQERVYVIKDFVATTSNSSSSDANSDGGCATQ